MSGKTIGASLNHGFAGSYARHPEQIISTRPSGQADDIPFGAPLSKGTDGAAIVFDGASAVASDFIGVASKEVKSALSYPHQEGVYAEGEPVSVFQRGSINVLCAGGTPAINDPVYIEGSDFTAASSGTTVPLTIAQWGGPKDANGIAELVLLVRANA
jgi:hypothetical protein